MNNINPWWFVQMFATEITMETLAKSAEVNGDGLWFPKLWLMVIDGSWL